MVLVNVLKNDDFYDEVTISGHALYDNYGKDIVCSAISSIVITTINAILTIDDKAINYEHKSDRLVIKVLKKSDIVDKLILNMLNMLKSLEGDYPKNIKIL